MRGLQHEQVEMYNRRRQEAIVEVLADNLKAALAAGPRRPA
jgi:hypothetical protein